MKQLSYSPAALEDLKAITLYIADDSPERALTFVEELQQKAAQAAEWPNLFPARDDLSTGLRCISHGRYLIFYHRETNGVRVVRVLHGARDLKGIFES
jgi:toxin ParE1/3/4